MKIKIIQKALTAIAVRAVIFCELSYLGTGRRTNGCDGTSFTGTDRAENMSRCVVEESDVAILISFCDMFFTERETTVFTVQFFARGGMYRSIFQYQFFGFVVPFGNKVHERPPCEI